MTCPHAETTTIAWLYGDAHDSHALHVASCRDCSDVLDVHERVGRTTSRVAPLILRPAAPHRTDRRFAAAAVALAIAAFVVLVFLITMVKVGDGIVAGAS